MRLKSTQKKPLSMACQIGLIGLSVLTSQNTTAYGISTDSSDYNSFERTPEEWMLLYYNEEQTAYNIQKCGRGNASAHSKVNEKSYLNNFVDIKTGGIIFDEVEFDSGHDILPLKIARRYQTALSYGKLAPLWFGWNSFQIYGELTDNPDFVRNYAEYECNANYPYGPVIYLSQGYEGDIQLHSKVSNEGIVEWYKINKNNNAIKVRLEKNSNGTWTYFNADKNREETYSDSGSILKITDPVSKISLTWTRDINTGNTQITRTGGEWIKTYTGSNGDSVTETSGGEKFISSKTFSSLEHIDKNNKRQSKIYTYKNNLLTKVVHSNNYVQTTLAEWTWNNDGFISKQVVDGVSTTFSNKIDVSKNEVEVTSLNSRGATTKTTLDKGTLDIKKFVTAGDGTPTATTVMATEYDIDFVETHESTNSLGIHHEYSTNSKGWISSVYDALNSDDQTHTQTIWHDKWKLPLQIITDTSITTYEYYSNDRPLLTKATSSSTNWPFAADRIWSYSYGFHNNGLVSYVRIDGPRADVSDVSYRYYDANGRLTKEINELGQETTYSNYDANGRATHINFPDNTSKKITYNSRGWIEQEEVGNSYGVSIVKYAYDTRGNVISVTDPAQKTILKSYTSSNKLASEGIFNERKYYTYDDLGKLAETKYGFIDPEMETKIGTESCEINEDYGNIEYRNCVTYTLDMLLNKTAFNTYMSDVQGRTKQSTDSRKNSITYFYDILGRRSNTQDPKSNVIETTTYDNLDRVKTHTDALGRKTTYQYDKNGNTIKITDNANRNFEYAYDAFGNITWSCTPNICEKEYEYDRAGNLISEILPDGSSIGYEYDALQRMTIRSLSDGNEHYFIYDTTIEGLGQLGKIIDDSGYTEYQYNNTARKLSNVKYSIENSTYNISYTYDAAGNLASMTYPSGYQILYRRNSYTGKITAIINSAGTPLLQSIQYLPFGPLSSYTSSSNSTVTFSTDGDYRTTKIISGGLNISYTYDNAGLISHKINNLDATKNTEYTYYNNYELKNEKRNYTNTVAYTNLDYSYDEIGNRLKLDTYTRSNNTTQTNQFAYDSFKALSSFNFLTVLKDHKGNIVQDQIHGAITTRTFNSLNKMTKSVFNGSTTTYRYNAHGHRTLKHGRFGKYHFIYDGNGRILAESLNGTITKEYIYLNNLLVSIRYNGAIFDVSSDASGRPESITNSGGTVVWRAKNYAFDREIEINLIGDMNIGYPGQYYDKETDTWYNINRDYDAKAGRYIQSDPLGTIDGPNTYIYVGNNPVSAVDPSGMSGKVASGVMMLGSGIKLVGRLSKEAAVRLRRQGKNIHSDNKQVQMQIEKAANINNNKILDHSKGHNLNNSDGSLKIDKNGDPVKGAGHIQTEGVSGHNFAGSQGVVNSIVVGAAVGFEAVGDTLEAMGEGLEKVEETFPSTMQLLDPMGTFMEQITESPPCEYCEA